MKMVVRLTIVCTVLLTVVGSVAWAFPTLATDIGFDFWNMSEYEREVNDSQRAIKDLDRIGNNVMNRMKLKDDLIEDLIAERESFRDVVIQFWVLNQQRPAIMNMVRINYEGNNDLERLCRNVMDFVHTRHSSNPSIQAEWQRKLQLEMQLLLEDPELNMIQ